MKKSEKLQKNRQSFVSSYNHRIPISKWNYDYINALSKQEKYNHLSGVIGTKNKRLSLVLEEMILLYEDYSTTLDLSKPYKKPIYFVDGNQDEKNKYYVKNELRGFKPWVFDWVYETTCENIKAGDKRYNTCKTINENIDTSTNEYIKDNKLYITQWFLNKTIDKLIEDYELIQEYIKNLEYSFVLDTNEKRKNN